MLYPIILAGGTGTRLWPVSSQANPKQFKALLGKYTLLQKTYQRTLKGFDKENVFVVSAQSSINVIKEQIDIKGENILLEPIAKGTAMAIGYAALKLSMADPEAIIVTINSDHHIKKENRYLEALKKAEQIIEKNSQAVLLFGVKPVYPETGYGYIQYEPIVGSDYGKVISLKEKPDSATAESYINSGNFLWSPGIFVFKAKRLLELYKEFLPVTHKALMAIAQGEDLTQQYQRVEDISIDYALLEKMKDMLVLPVDFGWADIGHWRSLRDIQLADNSDINVTNSKNVLLDSKGNLLYSFSNKLVAAIGVENMILVETDKAIFLCPADRAQEVKKILAEMSSSDLEEYL